LSSDRGRIRIIDLQNLNPSILKQSHSFTNDKRVRFLDGQHNSPDFGVQASLCARKLA
jgi:hypothetical protein